MKTPEQIALNCITDCCYDENPWDECRRRIAAAIAQERQSRVVGDDELLLISEREYPHSRGFGAAGMMTNIHRREFINGFRKAQSLNTIRAIDDVWPNSSEYPEIFHYMDGIMAFDVWLLTNLKQRLWQG